jgi:hypothetical protein
MDGIIMLNENFNINDLTPELYYNKIDAINDNYNRVINMPVAEDYIFENYIKEVKYTSWPLGQVPKVTTTRIR